MYETELVLLKLVSGGTMNVATIEAGDTGFTYGFHTLIVSAGSNDLVKMNLNGLPIELPGSCDLDKISIRTLSITQINSTGTTAPGVLLIGAKTKKSIF